MAANERAGIHNQVAVRRPDRIDGLTGDERDWRAAVDGNLEQGAALRVAAARHDPFAVRRPVDGGRARRTFDVDGWRQRVRIRAVRRHDREAPLTTLGGDDDSYAEAVARHRRRLGQGALRTLPDFGHESVAEPPHSVACSAGGEKKQRCAREARGQRTRRRQPVRLDIAILDDPMAQRRLPQTGGWVSHGGNDSTPVAAGRHRRIVVEPRKRPARNPGRHIECPQPRSGAVFRA